MTALLRPTLVRRVALAVLAASALVWLVLMAFEYVQTRQQEDHNPALVLGCQQVLDALSGIDDAGLAQVISAGIDRSTAGARHRLRVPGTVLLQVTDLQTQRLVYASPALADSALQGEPDRQTRQRLQGTTYHVVQANAGRWSVRLAQSRLESAWVLQKIHEDLTMDVLIAVPFILLPVWLAAWQGLKPLRRLSALLEKRGPDEMAPIGFDPKYAELKPLVSALDGLLVKLAGKLEREQAFVQDAAHELRTPLAVISAQAHALARAADDSQRQQARVQIDHSVARASHLIQQLLVLARLGMESPARPAPVDLARLLRRELAQAAPAAAARQMDIALEAPDSAARTLDEQLFLSVLHNLVDNAIRYGREGGHIVVTLQPGAQAWVLSVADDGPGIAPPDRAAVFERFHRGAGHDASGTGLGLAIVKQALARLGGQVALAEGIGGAGCCFVVTLPG